MYNLLEGNIYEEKKLQHKEVEKPKGKKKKNIFHIRIDKLLSQDHN
jgi:hypothetical protein